MEAMKYIIVASIIQFVVYAKDETATLNSTTNSAFATSNPTTEMPQSGTVHPPASTPSPSVKHKAYYAYYGIMIVRQRNSSSNQVISEAKTCASFYPQISNMSKEEATAEFYPLIDTIDWSPCWESPSVPVSNRIAIINGTENNPNCTLLHSASMVQHYGGSGTLFVRDAKPPSQNDTSMSMWLAFISNTTYESLLRSGDPEYMDVAVYTPEESFNYSLVIIWLLAMFTVTVGSYWSGRVRNRLYLESQQMTICDHDGGDDVLPGPGGSSPALSGAREQQDGDVIQPDNHDTRMDGDSLGGQQHNGTAVYPKEETSLDITPKVALLFVVLMCVMLVSLYFLYPYLVYIIIALFCIASVSAVYACLEPLVERIPCGTCRTPYFNLYLVRGQLEVRHLILMLFSLSLAITWVCLRHEPYAWILQDILGIAFCINMLRVIRLPSLKICTILLSCLFFYDIFFVFITPLFTADGNSIMVEVAQGSDSGEQLPMVFIVPHFGFSEVVQVCSLPNEHNLLGFGDVLVPGLLIAFVYSFDLKVRGGGKWPVYFPLNVVAYAVGLSLTFVGLYLMRGAQPALLYLVPCTLLSTVICAAIRGELAAMWQGDTPQHQDYHTDSKTDQDDLAPPLPVASGVSTIEGSSPHHPLSNPPPASQSPP